MQPNMIGKNGRLFAELQPGGDEVSFQVDNTSNQYFNSPYYTMHKDQLQLVPPPKVVTPRIALADIVGDDPVQAIVNAGSITFHAVGDTGAAKNNNPATEAAVADLMVADIQAGGVSSPAFFFHLGDVVYYFGEGQYYYDQFYEPFRAYDRPIFAIPGNHDGMVFGSNTDDPQVPTLQAFMRNFCADTPAPSPDALNLVRSVMTQPGVYFTLDAPFVSIIGLYSNVLEGPGVISSQGGVYPIGDEQITFLQTELTRLKPLRETGQIAVILAVHHPPLSADSKHGGTVGLSDDIDTACRAAGLWPDAVISGHAHLYQRFTRRVDSIEIPYIVSGSGGFAATRPQAQIPPAPVTVGDHTLEKDPVIDFGYLLLQTDAKTLTITFHSPNPSVSSDSVVVNLQTRLIVV